MQMETHLVEGKSDQGFDYLITAGGHTPRATDPPAGHGLRQTMQANPNPSHIQAATSSNTSAPGAMGHHSYCPRQHRCFSFSPLLPVMAAGRHRPGQWPGQQLHAGVLLCGLLAAATLDRISFHPPPRTPGCFGGSRCRNILVARFRAACGRWGRGGQCD